MLKCTFVCHLQVQDAVHEGCCAIFVGRSLPECWLLTCKDMTASMLPRTSPCMLYSPGMLPVLLLVTFKLAVEHHTCKAAQVIHHSHLSCWTIHCHLVILGRKLSMPIIVAPMSQQRMANDEGELAVARAVAKEGTAMVSQVNQALE